MDLNSYLELHQTSHCKISQSLEGARSVFWVFQPLWNWSVVHIPKRHVHLTPNFACSRLREILQEDVLSDFETVPRFIPFVLQVMSLKCLPYRLQHIIWFRTRLHDGKAGSRREMNRKNIKIVVRFCLVAARMRQIFVYGCHILRRFVVRCFKLSYLEIRKCTTDHKFERRCWHICKDMCESRFQV